MPGLGGQVFAAATDAVPVAAPAPTGDEGMANVKGMFETLKTENLALHGELIAEKTAHAHLLLDNVSLQWNMKTVA